MTVDFLFDFSVVFGALGLHHRDFCIILYAKTWFLEFCPIVFWWFFGWVWPTIGTKTFKIQSENAQNKTIQK